MITPIQKYPWLGKIGQLPKVVTEAFKWYGTHEGLDNLDNTTILIWARTLRISEVYTHDSIPWCGLFIAFCVKMAGYLVVTDPLWAANWLHFGIRVTEPMFGDVCVFTRNGGHHVALYMAEDAGGYWVYGGNQSDEVCFTWIAKNRLVGAMRCIWGVGQPDSVRKYYIDRQGARNSTMAEAA